MMNDCKYNKIKVLYDLSALCWFIDKHALADAKKMNDAEGEQVLQMLKKDLDKHIAEFEKKTCK